MNIASYCNGLNRKKVEKAKEKKQIKYWSNAKLDEENSLIANSGYLANSGLPTWFVEYLEYWASPDSTFKCQYTPDNISNRIVSHTFSNGVGTITFEKDLLGLPPSSFYFADKTANPTKIKLSDSIFCIGESILNYVPDKTFSNPTKNMPLKEMNIPKNLMFLDDYSFQSIGWDMINLRKSNWTVSEIPKGCCVNNTNLENVIFNKNTHEIYAGAFANCYNLSITSLPDPIEDITPKAFQNCISLRLKRLPTGADYGEYCWVREHSFENCRSLAISTIPETVTDIYDYAFANCVSMPLSSLPSNLENIKAHAFDRLQKFEDRYNSCIS